MKISKEAAVAAAEWWANKIDGSHHHDNGDHSSTGVIANALADMLMKPVTEEQVSMFKEYLVESIMDEKNNDFVVWGGLHCDYQPDKILWDAAEEAGICTDNFPFKTSTHFDERGVLVRDGYGAPLERIYEIK